MLCAAIDIGSNTTRVLVAEPIEGQLKKVMEQRAYTRINKALGKKGEILPEKVEEVCEVVATQVRLAQELGAEEIRAVATAAIREASNGEKVAAAIGEAAGVQVDVLSDEEEGRLSFIGATKASGTRSRARSASSTSAAARPRSSSAASAAASTRCAPGGSARASSPTS